MLRRFPLLALMFTLMVVLACGSGEPEAGDAMPEADSAAMTAQADEAAIDQLRSEWVTHYNLHHPDMVAALYSDSAFVLNADLSVDEGREAIQASLTEAMAANPTATVTSRDIMIFGDQAVSMGDYQVTVAPEGGDPASWSGHYLNYLTKVDGEWRITGIITNYDSPRPEDWQWAEDMDEAPPEDGTMTEVVEAYETHWNLQHPDMVAELFAPDATVAFAGRGLVEGRAAVGQLLAERMAAMATNIDVHDVGTMALADGWALDGGWYELTPADGGEVVQSGMYMNLMQRMDDGSWKIRWTVSNGRMGGS